MPHYYPIMVNLKEQPVLVVGGGTVALRKVETLLKHGAKVTIISPEVCSELKELINHERCVWIQKEYSASDINEAILIFSCTDHEEVNAAVANDAHKMCRPVNVVDDPEKCSFIVPSIMNRGDLTIAVSTSGSSPIVARQIRAEIEALYGEDIETYLDLLRKWRMRAKIELTPRNRALFWDKVTDGQVRNLIKQYRHSEAEGVIKQCFQSLLD